MVASSCSCCRRLGAQAGIAAETPTLMSPSMENVLCIH